MNHAAARTLPIRFVGSGSEYFRIWIVNLLLILVTLGIYYPFAKVRKLRYFHGATEVGGHPLAFHGEPMKMLRGYLLVAALLALYAAAGQVSSTGGVIALVIVAALWPALWHSSLRFRLANTGWRGLRFRFTGSRRGAYAVMLAWLGLALLAIVSSLLAGREAGGRPSAAAVLVGALAPLLMAVAFPALLWHLRKYQHSHFALGGERGSFTAPVRSFYGVFVVAGLMTAFVILVFGVLVALTLPALFGRGGSAGGGISGGLFAVGLLGALGYVVLLSVVGAYVRARLQNVVWNGTRSQHIGFVSQLEVGPLARLTLKNWLLIVITLGLYIPFAAVAVARLRLEAVSVQFDVEPDALVAVAAKLDESAAGDAAGDLLGLDLGL